ncbi:MAG: ribose 5-phosphate isomerase B [Geobacteraceae bacterium GWC2_55_20]|nr:MAG: ribose 5-phosphate isomerase B [Geobacteraceae bacterium GWC2_55_20]OGU21159.1 MAG: ribose 5-phosphate isomerase B [Geobacteraceae bacterium GWF2_54_21]HBA71402.1 ribose 5-phosphate isomerase B [Geobacter sp.]HCE67472.1 ribose 5-phosphate isomerase B [Geobacter sp.]
MIVIGSDHGGLNLKTALNSYLTRRGYEVTDAGTDSDASVDYPDFGQKVAEAVIAGQAELGILICGTGIGMSIAANKIPGIRAALVTDVFMARMAREHNNANILVLGGRVLDEQKACDLVGAWLDASFEGGRHQNRLDKITSLEQKYNN